MITVKVTGISTIKNRVRKINIGTYQGVKKTIEEGITETQKIASEFLDKNSQRSKWWGGVGGRSQTIERQDASINKNWITWPEDDVTYKDGMLFKTLANKSPHAHMVEFGTCGPITPIGDKPLYFWYEDHWVSTWKVSGQPPKRYLTYGIELVKDWILPIYKSNIQARW